MHFDDFGNSDKVIDWGEVDQDGITPLEQPIVTALAWALPAHEATGWAYRPTGQTIGYADKLGHFISLSRAFQYAWNGQALPTTIRATLHGTAALDRHTTGGGVAPTPSDASVDGLVTLTTLSYDNFGNIRRVESPNGRCADILYDLTHHQLPLFTVAYRHGCDSADPLLTQRKFDRGIEAVVQVQGPGG
jgi:hypothetical protein